MAQFYTLDEAAARLGIPADEFKRRTKTEWTALRPFRDGATLRYRAADVDELARSLGAASDPGGLALGTPGRPLGDSSEESALNADSPIDLGPNDSGTDDIFTLSAGDSGRSKKPAGDSDVKLTADPPAARRPTDALSLDPPAKKGGSSGRLTAPKSGPRLTSDPAGSDSSSEFELALDADSDSFDLQLADDGSDAVDLSAPAAKKGPQSGINLGRPADSGVSLEKKRPAADDGSDMDFELSLDPPGASGVNLGGPRTGPQARATGVDSSSEFELSLDDSSEGAERLAADIRGAEGQGDIFETDFDLPAVDESGSEVVAVEAEADDGFEVDVAEDDVVTADDEAVVLSDDDSVEIEEEAVAGDPSAVRALRGVSRADAGPARVVAAAPAVWGPLPAAVLLPSLVFLFLGSIMSYEALRGMWGYHQPSKPANGLIRGVAELVAGKVAD